MVPRPVVDRELREEVARGIRLLCRDLPAPFQPTQCTVNLVGQKVRRQQRRIRETGRDAVTDVAA